MNVREQVASAHVVILGAGIMQVPALRRAREICAEVTAVDGNPEAPGRSISHHFVHADISNPDQVLDALLGARPTRKYAGVLTVGTDFSTSVAAVAAALGLPGLNAEVAAAARDKLLMRTAFLEAAVPSPPFIAAAPGAVATPDFPGPWVVKPRRSMGARGVQLVSDGTELSSAVDTAARFDPDGACIVEGMISGPEFSIDALVHDGIATICGIADRQIGLPPAFVELGHTLPSSYRQLEQDSLVSVFVRGVQALGIRSGAAKGDVFLTSHGPVIGEIAARLSGGFMSGWTFPAATGLESIDGAIAEAIGADHREIMSPGVRGGLGSSAERGILGLPGRLTRVRGIERVESQVGHLLTYRSVADNAVSTFPRSNVEKLGNIIFTGRTPSEADERAEAALRLLLAEYSADSPEARQTVAFLLGQDSRQDAYPRLRTVLPRTFPGADSESMRQMAATSLPGTGPIALGHTTQLETVPGVDWFHRTIRESLNLLERLGVIRKTAHDGPLDPWVWHALMRGGASGALFAVASCTRDTPAFGSAG